MLAGEVVDGKYHLRSFIAAGSYGAVFRTDEVVGGRVMRTLALKLLPPPEGGTEAETAQLREYQLAELQAAASVDHPHIVRTYSVGECTLHGARQLYLAMELGSGTLLQRMRSSEVSTTEVHGIARQLAAALAYLHGAAGGMVHRDIKPANVLRVGPHWKLSDLGTARVLAGQAVATSRAIGTAEYAPPESYRGEISPAWDIWSFGVLLAELLCGKRPFAGNTAHTLMHAVLNDAPQLPENLSEPFAAIVRGCLHKQRERRLTAGQLVEQLEQQPGNLAGGTVAQALAAPATGELARPRPGAQPTGELAAGDALATGELGQAGRTKPVQQSTSSSPQPPAPSTPKSRTDLPMPDRPPVPPPELTPPPTAQQRSEGKYLRLRYAVRAALADGRISRDERSELNRLRRDLGVPLDDAIAIFEEEHELFKSGAAMGKDTPELKQPMEARIELRAVHTRDKPAAKPAPEECSETIIVDADGARDADYSTIGAAVAGSKPGANISVRAGIYREQLVIAGDVKITGEGGAGQVQLLCEHGHALIVRSGKVQLRNLAVKCAEPSSEEHMCAVLQADGELELSNCQLSSDSDAGLTVLGEGTLARLRDCTIRGARNTGVSASHGAELKLAYCDISLVGIAAAFCGEGSRLQLDNCRLHVSRQYGILVHSGGVARAEQCHIHENGIAGVLIEPRAEGVLRQCRVMFNGHYGVQAAAQAVAHIESCDLGNNRTSPYDLAEGSSVVRSGNRPH